MPTGTSLQPAHHGLTSGTEQGPPGQLSSPSLVSSSTQPHEIPDPSIPDDNAADIGMIALNATGEMRYLGPSSGAFFASYTSALVRSCISTQNLWNITTSTQQANAGKKDVVSVNDLGRLSAKDVNLFLRSYKMWIQPLYPVLNSDDLDMLVLRYNEGAEADNPDCGLGLEKSVELMLFYLVMALGAINDMNTVKQMRIQPEQDRLSDLSTPRPSSVSLCTRVLRLMDRNSQKLHPSVGLIQAILLISIYSSYGPIGSSQWQLAGLAMRVFLICSSFFLCPFPHSEQNIPEFQIVSVPNTQA